jgi:hypothetical protein
MMCKAGISQNILNLAFKGDEGGNVTILPDLRMGVDIPLYKSG